MLHEMSIAVDDSLPRRLLQKADEDGCPIDGRHFELRTLMGRIYGTLLYAGKPPINGGTELVLVCRSTVTYTEKDL